MKNTTDYQLATLRRQFAARGYEPANRRRMDRKLFKWFHFAACAVAATGLVLFIIRNPQ